MVQLLTPALIERVLEQARQTPRRRMNFNFHASMEENPHRFLNVLLEGTYITPHRHLNPPKAESFIVMEGRLGFLVFDDSGAIERRWVLGAGGDALGIDVPPGVWHSLISLTPHAVCYEVKPGPYSAATDKDFPPWAPREGAPGVAEYLASLSR